MNEMVEIIYSMLALVLFCPETKWSGLNSTVARTKRGNIIHEELSHLGAGIKSTVTFTETFRITTPSSNIKTILNVCRNKSHARNSNKEADMRSGYFKSCPSPGD